MVIQFLFQSITAALFNQLHHSQQSQLLRYGNVLLNLALHFGAETSVNGPHKRYFILWMNPKYFLLFA